MVAVVAVVVVVVVVAVNGVFLGACGCLFVCLFSGGGVGGVE